MNQEKKVGETFVGKSLIRVDGLEMVTGRAIYTADLSIPHMLHGKILRSTYPHAKILKIDTSKAEKLPDVKAIVTAKDAPYTKIGLLLKDSGFLARDKVRYIGEPVAAVAAVDEVIAKQALDLIEVEYEELPYVVDPIEAMKPDAPLIHEKVDTYTGYIWGEPLKNYSKNACGYAYIHQGDVKKGFKEAEFIFEDTFRTQMQDHCYIEPHVALASFDPFTSKVTVWTSTGAPFLLRLALAEGLMLPMNKIRIITHHVGGSFGGKALPELEPLCILLARKTNRLVKIVATRQEEFIGFSHRLPCFIKRKIAVKKDGLILALETELVYDAGAYAGSGVAIMSYASMLARGPYRIPNVNITGYCVYTNKTSGGPFRGFGDAQSCFAYESQMDIIADRLGIDPLELRLKNAVEEGDAMATGQVTRSVGLKQCLEKAAERANWKEKKARGVGIGVACMQHLSGELSSCAVVKVNEDGTIGVLTGAVEIGQGALTILTQIVAEELGVPPEDVLIITGDTDATPYDSGSVASRVTYHMGNAVKAAAADAKRQLLLLAANILEVNVEDLDIKDKKIFVKGVPERGISFAELAVLTHFVTGGPEGGPIMGKGSFFAAGVYNKANIEGAIYPPGPTTTYAAQIAEVKVDRETGEVKVIKITAAHDCGHAINPRNIEGQIEGGVSIGLGLALTEEMVFAKAHVANATFMDYKISTPSEMPQIESLIVEVAQPDGPFGAKGVGEPTLVTTSPAIANAVYDAVKVRITTLPLTPEKILNELKKKGK